MAKKTNVKRDDGRYLVRVYIGTKDSKKIYKYVYGKTQKEADQKAEELRVSMRKGVDISASNDSFKTWADYWLMSKKHEVSSDRYNTLSTRAGVWIDAIQNVQIKQIKPFELQTILFSISAKNPNTGKPMSKKTTKEYIQVINSIFEFAHENRVLEYNPATKLKVPQMAAEPLQRRALSEEERQRVMEFEHRAKPSAMLMMLSGLRRGEATALQWNDIDFENNKISVTKSFNFKTKEFKAPKNGKARIVSVPQVLIDYLSTLPRSSFFVLTNAKGRMMTDDSWRRLYESYMYDMNLYYGFNGDAPKKFSHTKVPMIITPFTPHELRHTFCTIMYEAGIDSTTAKDQMGHADIQTTLSIYTHLSSQKKERDIKKLDDYFEKASQGRVSHSLEPA